MFKQINDLAGGEYYLIASLLIFMVFFIIVGIYIFKLSKGHIDIMRNMPIEDQPSQLSVYEKD